MKTKKTKPHFVHVHRDRLDEDWEAQPELVYNWGNKLADAKEAHAFAKLDLELAEVTLDKRIRRQPERFGIKKLTEDAIKAAIIRHPLYQKLARQIVELKHRMDKLDVTMTALTTKTKSIENMTYLWGQQYFGGDPKELHGTRGDRELNEAAHAFNRIGKKRRERE